MVVRATGVAKGGKSGASRGTAGTWAWMWGTGACTVRALSGVWCVLGVQACTWEVRTHVCEWPCAYVCMCVRMAREEEEVNIQEH